MNKEILTFSPEPSGITNQLQEAGRMFLLQMFNYGLMALSYRVLAVGILWLTMVVDGIYSILAFSMIRQVAAADPKNPLARIGYVLGSVAGTGVGVVVSKWIMGGR
jgi:hypothetical protein